MKIRSITYFLNPQWPLNESELHAARKFITSARPSFESNGYQVQTTRLATIPFPHLINSWKNEDVITLALELENIASSLNYDYVSLGPALPELPNSYRVVPDVLAETKSIFLSGKMTSSAVGVSIPAVFSCAEIIKRVASINPDGFANLRFAALANVPPGSPFFPAAYHDSDSPKFALATEAADLAVEAFNTAESLQDSRLCLIDLVEKHAFQLEKISTQLTSEFDLPFGGIDFSLSPFPEEELSLGTAMENMGVPGVGRHGSLAAAAILADTLDKASFQRTGFSGLMLPVLEDSILASRAKDGLLSVEDLMLYSAVCGTGLDTLPLPGDTSTEQLFAVLLDLASLAQRLDKPLTARLMPIPGKVAGDLTDFDFPFFANSRVLSVRAEEIRGQLVGGESIQLAPREK